MWMRTPTEVALQRLAGCPDEVAAAEMLALFLQSRDRPGFAEIQTRLKSGDQLLATGLLKAAASDYCGDAAEWALRVLAVGGDSRAVPILLQWLKSPAAKCRRSGAWNLTEVPSTNATQALLDVVREDSDPTVRDMALVALAQTGDSRGLDILLTAASQSPDRETQLQAVRGLGRIRNPKALTTLALIARRPGSDPGVVGGG
jgi:HEAT repeat protein